MVTSPVKKLQVSFHYIVHIPNDYSLKIICESSDILHQHCVNGISR